MENNIKIPISICDLDKKKARDNKLMILFTFYASISIALIIFIEQLSVTIGTVAAMGIIVAVIIHVAEELLFTQSCTEVYDVSIDNQYIKFNYNDKEILINIFDYKDTLIFNMKSGILLLDNFDNNKYIQFNFNNNLKELGKLSEIHLNNYMKCMKDKE